MFAEGVAVQWGVGVGLATIAISLAILLAWIPLRQRLGIATLANAIVVGIALDVVLAVIDRPAGGAGRIALLTGGIALVAVGSGLYLTTFLGPGPRDGLMTGLHRRTGASIGAVRTAIEASALLAGWVLGGTLGIGTLAFAVTIGPAVAAMLGLLAKGSLVDL